MIEQFLKLDLDDVEAGMTLYETLLDGHGGVLLPAGTELSESNLNSLRRRGVDEVLIRNDAVSEADLAEARAQLEERLARLFRQCGTEGANGLLLQSVIRYRLGDAA